MGEVRSPNFNIKKMYPRNYDCIWHIIGPYDHYLILNFKTLDLEISEINDCLSVDHVSLEEDLKFNETCKFSENFKNKESFVNTFLISFLARTIGTYCGNQKPGEITTSSNEVIVHLVTGNTEKELAGFSLQFNSSQEGM